MLFWITGRFGRTGVPGAPGGGLPPGASNQTLRFDLATGLWIASAYFLNSDSSITIGTGAVPGDVRIKGAGPVNMVRLLGTANPSDFMQGIKAFSATSNNVLSDNDSNALIQYNVFAQNDIYITSDNGAGLKGYLYAGDDVVWMQGSAGIDAVMIGDNIIGFSTGAQDFLQGGFGAMVKVVDNSAIAVGSSAIDKSATFVANRSGTQGAGVVNSPLIGGTGQLSKTDNLPLFQRLGFNAGGAFESILDFLALTADRLISIPDEDGTVGILIPVGVAGTASENAGTNNTASRSDHEHSVNQTITIALGGVLATGPGQQPFNIEIPNDNYTVIEIAARVKVAAGTAFTLQIVEFNASGVSQGDVISGAGLALAAATNAQTVSFVGGRTTPGKGFYYGLDLDTITGTPPEDVIIQIRCWEKTDDKAV